MQKTLQDIKIMKSEIDVVVSTDWYKLIKILLYSKESMYCGVKYYHSNECEKNFSSVIGLKAKI